MKHITLDNGAKIGVFSKAPADFNPLTASAVDLRRFGFPSVPKDTHNRARYEQIFQQMQGKLNYIEPQFKLIKLKAQLRDKTLLPAAPITIGNIKKSGINVVTSNLDPFRWMQADWVLPNVSAVPRGNDSFCAFWIELSAPGSLSYLVGVRLRPSRNQVSPFWQWIDAQGHGVILDIVNFIVRPGDFMSAILCTDEGSGSTSGTIYLFNLTNGSHTSFTTSGPALTQTTIAEWGVGFPFLWTGDASTLGDYGEVFFSSCNAVTNKFVLHNSSQGIVVNLTQDGTTGSKVFSAATQINDNIIRCRYLGPTPA